MINLTKHLTLSLLLCLCVSGAYAQHNGGAQKKDDKKEYPPKVYVWQLDEDYTMQEYDLKRDTSMHLFQVYDNNDKNSLSVNNLGNMGSPYLSNIFDDRMQNRRSPVFFMDYMSDFISKPGDTKFYKVNHPYTSLYYTCTPKARNGQTLDFTHSQNASEKLNWGFNLGLVSSMGRYSHQHMRDVNATPHISYTGKHLNIHFFYKFNKMQVEENGGIDDSQEVINNRFTTLLDKPESLWGDRSWNLVGEYSLGKSDFDIINDTTRHETYTPRISFGYAFRFNRIFRKYEDSDIKKKYYENYYINSVATYDSLYYSSLSNRFFLKIFETQYLPQVKASIGMENVKYSNFYGYLEPEKSQTYLNTYLEGAISKNKSRNLILNGRYRQYTTGYKMGDMLVNGNLGFKGYKGESDTVNYQVKASADFRNEEPTYFENHYYSNNFRWNNTFKKTQTMRIGGEIEFPRWHMKIGASNYWIENYIYINNKAVPEQYSNSIMVQSLSLMKDFYVWKLRFANRATLQNSKQNEILNLPKFALYHATYLEFYLVKDVLLTQIGGEVRYSGEYNAFGYSPATSLFYLTDRLDKNGGRIKAGNYPLINGFVNIKIHGAIMFFKWEHIDGGMIKEWYAATDCYPIQDFHFMFGILWRFKD